MLGEILGGLGGALFGTIADAFDTSEEDAERARRANQASALRELSGLRKYVPNPNLGGFESAQMGIRSSPGLYSASVPGGRPMTPSVSAPRFPSSSPAVRVHQMGGVNPQSIALAQLARARRPEEEY